MTPFAENGCGPQSAIHAIEAVDPPIPMLILERGLKIRWVSRAAIEELGLRAERLVGRTWYDLFPDARARVAEHDDLFTGKRASLDLPRIALSLGCDQPRYFSLRVRPIKSPDGSVEAVLGVGEDVTEQVRAEHALHDNEERFRAISTHSQDLILIANRDGTISFANAALESVLGRRASDRVGTSIFEYIHPEDLQRAQAAFQRLIDDPNVGSVPGIEVRKRRQDGAWRWLQFTATNLLDDNRVRGIVLNGRDITERKNAEAAATLAQARLDAALWGAQVSSYSVDLAHDRAEVSSNFFEITGIDPASWLADEHPWDRRIHARDRRAVLEHLAAHIAGKTEAFEAEYRLRTPRGWLWILDRARVTVRDADNRPQTLAGTVIDISARKQLEREIVETVSREQQRLGQDLHDGLGQELTGISLLFRSIATRLKREPATACEDEIDLAISHLNNAIRNARALAHGLYPISPDGGGIVGALAALTANAQLAHGVRVEFDSSNWWRRTLPEDVANHVYRIAQEALANSMRHAGASRIVIRLAATTDALDLTVSDDGGGVTEKILTSPGLGRRIMNYRAQLIGGNVAWQAVETGGTKVTLHLPWPVSSST